MAACARGGDGTYGGAAVAGEPRKLPKGACTAVPDNTVSSDADSSDTGSGSSLGTETDILAIHSKIAAGRAHARKRCGAAENVSRRRPLLAESGSKIGSQWLLSAAALRQRWPLPAKRLGTSWSPAAGDQLVTSLSRRRRLPWMHRAARFNKRRNRTT